MYRVSVNKKNFDVVDRDGDLFIDGSKLDWDITEISGGYFHILINKKSYRAEVVKADASTKSFVLKVNGKVYSVDLRDRFDLLLEKMGMNNGASGKANSIKAPMPGLIINLHVKEGDQVMPGDALLILEAMKMENLIKASAQSVVKSVKVKKGDSVEKNQVLIEF
jgi:biotin carboxyl carrier protein